MRSNLAFISKRVGLNLAQSGTQITVTWTEWSGTPTEDPVTGSKTGTSVKRSITTRALLHFIQPTNGVTRQFNEVEVGDCIVDLGPDVPLDGKENIRFTIDGRQWMPKPVSPKLAQMWDVVAGGQRLFRTMLLSKET